MRPGLCTVATYSEAFEAQIARSKLVALGVRAFIADEHLTTLNPHYMGAALGIRLQVHHADLERAAEILSAPAADEVADEDDDEGHADGPKCPRCGARYAYREWSSGQLFVIVLLLGLPLLLLQKQWHCRRCQAYWPPPLPQPMRGSPYRAPRRSALKG